MIGYQELMQRTQQTGSCLATCSGPSSSLAVMYIISFGGLPGQSLLLER